MLNAKPGDHPYTDIVVYKWIVFGNETDNLVRKLHNMPGFDAYREEVIALLEKNDPGWNKEIDVKLVRKRLLEIRAQLKKERV